MIFEMSCNDTGCDIDNQCQPDQVWINLLTFVVYNPKMFLSILDLQAYLKQEYHPQLPVHS
jgi:hypothetical protein